MKPSDFKHIVKESLREAFYTKKEALSEIIGKELSLDITIDGTTTTHAALLSKNTIPHEKPYRFTWFKYEDEDEGNQEPLGHVDLSAKEFIEFLDGHPSKHIILAIANQIEADKIHINLKESINNQKMTVKYYGEILPAILTRNMKPDEKPYRISVFSPDLKEPRGHIELTKQEAEEILQNNKLPDDVIRIYGNNLKLVDLTRLPDRVVTEQLFLLEEYSRELDLWLENKREITETMNVVVSGADYKRTDRLDELVNYLQDTVVSPILRKMTDEQEIAYFHKNSVGFWNLLSADGSYYSMKDGNPALGTINLYPGGITSRYLRPIVVGILRQLKKMGIKWGQLKREPSGAYKISDVIRIPIIENNSKTYQGPPEVNLSNVNAYQIFHNLLQFEGEHSFTMDAKELMERIETLAHDKGWIDKHVINRTDSDWPEAERDEPQDIENPHLDIVNKFGNEFGGGGARMIGMGLDKEGIEFRLREIWLVAKWAVNHGYKTITVG